MREPTHVTRPTPTAEWRIEAGHDTRSWTDDITVQRYTDARYGETVRVGRRGQLGDVTIMMSPAVATQVAEVVQAAADWTDPLAPVQPAAQATDDTPETQ